MAVRGPQVAGGAYLIYMASKIWRGADRPIAMDDPQAMAGGSARKSFWTGLTTQLSNPKTAIWYGSIFAALLPQHPPLWCYLALPPLVFGVEFGWYTIVALCFSTRRPRGSTCARRSGSTASPPARSRCSGCD